MEPGFAVGRIKLEGGETCADGLFDLLPAGGVEAGRRQMPAVIAKARARRLFLRARDGAAQRFVDPLGDEGAEGGDAVLQGDLRAAPPGVGERLAADDVVEMGVEVDEARQDRAAFGIEDTVGLGERAGRTDGADAAARDEQIGLFDMVFENKGAVMEACRHGVHGKSPPFSALNG